MRAAIERFTADRGNLLRYYTMELAPARSIRMKKFYTEWLGQLPSGFETMSQAGKVDYLLFKNYLQHELRQLDLDAKNQAETQPLLPFSSTIIGLDEAKRRMDPVDHKKSAAALTALAKEVSALQKNTQAALRATPPSKAVANRAAGYVLTLRTVLRRWFDFYNGYDPMFTWWVASSHKEADAALLSYATFLREQVAGVRGGTQREPGGRRRGEDGSG